MLDNTFSYSTLFAGVTGSGKTYVTKRIIETLFGEDNTQFVLIDPKRVELSRYKDNLKVLFYAATEDDIYDTLSDCYDIMIDRFNAMADAGTDECTEPHIFIFIDEMAFLMQSTHRKEYIHYLSEIALIGRSAHVHLMLCTQVATQDVIPACIRDNVANIVCLRQRDAGKYRYLLGSSQGRLPRFGYAYVFTPDMERPARVKSEYVWEKITEAD